MRKGLFVAIMMVLAIIAAGCLNTAETDKAEPKLVDVKIFNPVPETVKVETQEYQQKEGNITKVNVTITIKEEPRRLITFYQNWGQIITFRCLDFDLKTHNATEVLGIEEAETTINGVVVHYWQQELSTTNTLLNTKFNYTSNCRFRAFLEFKYAYYIDGIFVSNQSVSCFEEDLLPYLAPTSFNIGCSYPNAIFDSCQIENNDVRHIIEGYPDAEERLEGCIKSRAVNKALGRM